MTEFMKAADDLLALAEVEADGELLEATRRLRDVAKEQDDVNARFEEAAQNVQRLLLERTS
jgi:hypothetical protein